MQGTNHGEEGGESLPCHPKSEVRTSISERDNRNAKIKNGIKKKNGAWDNWALDYLIFPREYIGKLGFQEYRHVTLNTCSNG